jgi:hypothetical protein
VLTNLINLKSNLFKNASNTFFLASLVYLILQQILPRIEIRSYIKVHIFFELFSSTDFADAKTQLKPNSITILDYAEALWQKGVDPNVPEKSEKPGDECPILQAAKEGRPEILGLFRGPKTENNQKVRLDVSSKTTGETVLHYILGKKRLESQHGRVLTNDQIKDLEKRSDNYFFLFEKKRKRDLRNF